MSPEPPVRGGRGRGSKESGSGRRDGVREASRLDKEPGRSRASVPYLGQQVATDRLHH